MLFGKPVAFSGKAFYSIKGVNTYCSNAEQVLELAISKTTQIDLVSAKQFLRHLAARVYSFGEQITKPVRMPDGSRMTATTDIMYEILRLPNHTIRTPKIAKPKISWESFLFDRYRFAEKQYLDSQKKPAQATRPKNSNELPIYEPIELPVTPTNIAANEESDNAIRNSRTFQLYYNLYSRFLTPSKAEHLWNRPSAFLQKAKHPASKLGRMLLSRYF